MLPEIKKQIIDSIHAALREIALSRGIESDLPLPHLERPKVAEHGDLATNIAMQLAKSWKMNPRELAVSLIEAVNRQHDFSMVVAAAEVVVGLAIIVTIFRSRRSASVDVASLLKR